MAVGRRGHWRPLLLLAGCALLATMRAPAAAAAAGAAGASAAAAPAPRAANDDEPPEECTLRIRKGIKWGVATAAYQIEGAWNVSGRSPSVWDVFAHTPGKIVGNATGDVACDHYHRFKDDVRLMASLGIKHYRFSIAWPRVVPGGRRGSEVNPEGVAFYNALLDELEAAGIKPMATMFHWDLPQSLHDAYKGPLSEEFVADFAAYADVLFRSFPRIRDWVTFNEPLITCDASYGIGFFAPGHKGGTKGIYACARNVLLAHAAAKEVSATKYRHLRHRLGIALNVEWAEPMTDSAEDRAAAQRNLDVQFGTFADPLFFGKWPPLLQQKFGSATVQDWSPEEAARVRGSLDWLGINFYTGKFVKGNGNPLGYVVSAWDKNGQPIGPQAGSSWLRVYPEGLYQITQYATRRYGRVEIRITENGVSVPGEADLPRAAALRDAFRTNYYRDYINQLCRSKRDGAKITAYMAWSLMDNFEWLRGYSERFGITHVDFDSQERSVKDSGRYLSRHFFTVN